METLKTPLGRKRKAVKKSFEQFLCAFGLGVVLFPDYKTPRHPRVQILKVSRGHGNSVFLKLQPYGEFLVKVGHRKDPLIPMPTDKARIQLGLPVHKRYDLVQNLTSKEEDKCCIIMKGRIIICPYQLG